MKKVVGSIEIMVDDDYYGLTKTEDVISSAMRFFNYDIAEKEIDALDLEWKVEE